MIVILSTVYFAWPRSTEATEIGISTNKFSEEVINSHEVSTLVIYHQRRGGYESGDGDCDQDGGCNYSCVVVDLLAGTISSYADPGYEAEFWSRIGRLVCR